MRADAFDPGAAGKTCPRWAYAVVVAMVAIVLACSVSYADTRVAVIGSQTAGVEKVVPLVELRLGQKQGIVLLEREALKEILREQKLQALVAAEGVGKRIALGKLLKADLLVLVQAEAKPQPHATVIICETKQGLRLCNQPVEFSKNLEADADAVARLVDRSVEKQSRSIDDIVAVPPLVNNTLAYEGDHLKAACARLIEDLLLDRPGVLVVELAEAKAIAQELTVGGGGTVQRRLPLYVMGEYRLEGHGEKQTVSFQLSLLRGSTQVDVRRGAAATVEELPKQVRDTAGEMLSKSLGQAVKPPDPEVEAKQLAERARLFSRLGNWEEALALTEAALLLKPDRYDLHGEAAALLSQIYWKERRKEFDQTLGNPRPDGPSHHLAKALLPASLHHAELYLRNTPLGKSSAVGWVCAHFWRDAEDAGDREGYDRYLEQNKAEMESIRAMCRRVLAAKAAAKVQDQSVGLLFQYLEWPMPRVPGTTIPNLWRGQYLSAHIREICDGRLRLLQDFTYLRGMPCLYVLEIDGSDGLRLFDDPAYLAFLRKAEALPNRDFQEVVKYLMGRWQQAEAAKKLRRMQPDAEVSPPRPTPVAKPQEETDPEVAFHPRPLYLKDEAGTALAFYRCLPTLAGIDLFINSFDVYLMKEKDELRRLPVRRNVIRRNSGFDDRAANVCFDGRFVWIASPDPEAPVRDEHARFLAVIDPETERIWKFTADDGLPPMGTRAGAAVAPFGPGRVCVAGFFGRTWCAVATFDLEKGKSLKVFFEAREIRSGDIAKGARDVEFLHAATGRSDPGKPAEERVLLGGNYSDAMLLDPRTGEVLKSVSIVDRDFVMARGDAVFWIGQPTGVAKYPLYKASFPDFSPRLIRTLSREGPCVVQKDRVLFWDQWQGHVWTAPSFDEEFRPLRGQPSRANAVGGWYGSTLCQSHHYGVVLLRDNKVWQLEFLKPPDALPAKPGGSTSKVDAPRIDPITKSELSERSKGISTFQFVPSTNNSVAVPRQGVTGFDPRLPLAIR